MLWFAYLLIVSIVATIDASQLIDEAAAHNAPGEGGHYVRLPAVQPRLGRHRRNALKLQNIKGPAPDGYVAPAAALRRGGVTKSDAAGAAGAPVPGAERPTDPGPSGDDGTAWKAPANPSDPFAWYPEFEECDDSAVTNHGPKLSYLSATPRVSPCVQLPLPPAAARFANTTAASRRPAVNTTQPGYLFVLGTPYGGTTGLLGLLSSSPRAAIPTQGWAHEMQWNLAWARPPVYPFLKHFNLRYQHAAKLWPDLKQDLTLHVEDYDRIAHKLWDPSKPIKVDKSHSLITIAPNLYQHFRSKGSMVKFIVLVRHPCTYSDQKKLHKKHLHRMRRFRRLLEDHPGDSLLVQYEEFVKDPAAVKQKILNFVPELELLDEAQNNLKKKNTSLGKVNLDRGLAIGGDNAERFWKQYVEMRFKRNVNMKQFSLAQCEGFPKARKEIMPEEGRDILRFFGWLH